MAAGGEALAWNLHDVRLIEAGHVAAPKLGPDSAVCSAYDESVCWDVGPFYRANKSRLVQVGVATALSPTWGLRLRITEGMNAPKATLRPRLLIGLMSMRALPAGRTLTLQAYTSVGGELVHRPCLDAYDRQYHCATLTAWEDFAGQRVRPKEFGFSVALRF